MNLFGPAALNLFERPLMKNENNNLNETPPDRGFSQDLQALFEPSKQPDWAAVDRAVMDKAAQRLLLVRRGRKFFKPAAAIAAAAAMLIAGVLVVDHARRAELPQTFAANDVNRDGRLDILDAFQLAKLVEASSAIDKKWDLNRDGIVDRKDVDVAAQAAVSLRKDVL